MQNDAKICISTSFLQARKILIFFRERKQMLMDCLIDAGTQRFYASFMQKKFVDFPLNAKSFQTLPFNSKMQHKDIKICFIEPINFMLGKQ